MKYTTEITVEVPRPIFIEKMDSIDNLKHWQQGLINYKLLSGTPGEEGSKMELSYRMGKRNLVLVETIMKKDLPSELHATYDTKGVHNIQKNHFKDIDGKSTLWISETEFQFSGFMMKVMGFLMPGAFKKQSVKYMQDFKAFAEDGISVAEKN
ncbi:SRPBCC family protein [Pareuzebyella sediminis]|uniref:SRPBCC family protein n=1 Tax=Pareuzebyella sediminis TaxID=2607998 RepID=UPI0011EF55FD|nr:SRPBCC family protein [Pareuzebyella sediminis]